MNLDQLARLYIEHHYPLLHTHSNIEDTVDYLSKNGLLDLEGELKMPSPTSAHFKKLYPEFDRSSYQKHLKTLQEELCRQILLAIENSELLHEGKLPKPLFDDEEGLSYWKVLIGRVEDFIAWGTAQKDTEYQEILFKAQRFKEALQILEELNDDLFEEAERLNLTEVLLGY